MSSATACPRFVQNAWKRDLCSHCFKPKEDHLPVQPPPAPTIFFTSKQPAQVYWIFILMALFFFKHQNIIYLPSLCSLFINRICPLLSKLITANSNSLFSFSLIIWMNTNTHDTQKQNIVESSF